MKLKNTLKTVLFIFSLSILTACHSQGTAPDNYNLGGVNSTGTTSPQGNGGVIPQPGGIDEDDLVPPQAADLLPLQAQLDLARDAANRAKGQSELADAAEQAANEAKNNADLEAARAAANAARDAAAAARAAADEARQAANEARRLADLFAQNGNANAEDAAILAGLAEDEANRAEAAANAAAEVANRVELIVGEVEADIANGNGPNNGGQNPPVNPGEVAPPLECAAGEDLVGNRCIPRGDDGDDEGGVAQPEPPQPEQRLSFQISNFTADCPVMFVDVDMSCTMRWEVSSNTPGVKPESLQITSFDTGLSMYQKQTPELVGSHLIETFTPQDRSVVLTITWNNGQDHASSILRMPPVYDPSHYNLLVSLSSQRGEAVPPSYVPRDPVMVHYELRGDHVTLLYERVYFSVRKQERTKFEAPNALGERVPSENIFNVPVGQGVEVLPGVGPCAEELHVGVTCYVEVSVTNGSIPFKVRLADGETLAQYVIDFWAQGRGKQFHRTKDDLEYDLVKAVPHLSTLEVERATDEAPFELCQLSQVCQGFVGDACVARVQSCRSLVTAAGVMRVHMKAENVERLKLFGSAPFYSAKQMSNILASREFSSQLFAGETDLQNPDGITALSDSTHTYRPNAALHYSLDANAAANTELNKAYYLGNHEQRTLYGLEIGVKKSSCLAANAWWGMKASCQGGDIHLRSGALDTAVYTFSTGKHMKFFLVPYSKEGETFYRGTVVGQHQYAEPLRASMNNECRDGDCRNNVRFDLLLSDSIRLLDYKTSDLAEVASSQRYYAPTQESYFRLSYGNENKYLSYNYAGYKPALSLRYVTMYGKQEELVLEREIEKTPLVLTIQSRRPSLNDPTQTEDMTFQWQYQNRAELLANTRSPLPYKEVRLVVAENYGDHRKERCILSFVDQDQLDGKYLTSMYGFHCYKFDLQVKLLGNDTWTRLQRVYYNPNNGSPQWTARLPVVGEEIFQQERLQSPQISGYYDGIVFLPESNFSPGESTITCNATRHTFTADRFTGTSRVWVDVEGRYVKRIESECEGINFATRGVRNNSGFDADLFLLEVPDAFEMSMGITFPTSNNVPMNQRTKFRCKITALGVANVPVFSRTY